MDETELGDGIVLRPVETADADGLARAYVRNREHLRPWEPWRPEHFFTTAGQEARLRDLAEQREAGRVMPWVLADGERLVGAVNLNDMVHGPFRNAHQGYWIDAGYAGRGLTTRAVEVVCRVADERLGLHRVQAGTLLDNVASQRVLRKCGFEPFGTAPNYLHINGEWRDHLLFQRILNDRPPPTVVAGR